MKQNGGVHVHEQMCMCHMCSMSVYSAQALDHRQNPHSCGQCKGNMYISNFSIFLVCSSVLCVLNYDSRDLRASHSGKTVLLLHGRLSAQLAATQVSVITITIT